MMPSDDTVLIAVAPNGARRTREQHAALPLSASQLAETAEQCLSAGAAMLHLHVRDEHGAHSLRPQRYAHTIEAIRERVGEQIFIQATTESAGICSIAEQLEVLADAPAEGFSIALREVLATDDANGTSEVAGANQSMQHCMHDKVAHALHNSWQNGAWLQYILYAPAEVARFFALHRAGLIPGDAHSLLFVVSRHGYDSGDVQAAGVAQLQLFQQALHAQCASDEHRCEWMVCAFDGAEYACALQAVRFGGDVRVGFENNLFNRHGQRAVNNAELVQQASDAVRDKKRKILNASRLRSRLVERALIPR